jgi:tetratricopeptide (TPR) repeat protein
MVMGSIVPMVGNNPLLLALLITVLACTTSPCAQMTGKTVRHHKQPEDDPSQAALMLAENAIEKKDYAGAETTLKKVVAGDPQNYRAWFDLGFVYNALARKEDSINAYRKSVAAKPDLFESNLNLGLMLARAGRPEAVQFFRAATKLTPTDHVEEGRERAWLSLAHVLETSKPQEALEAYRQAATLQPKDPEPHIAAGLLLERQNDLAEAEKEYQQVVALDPQSAEALTALANIYMRAKRFPEAESALRKLVVERPDDAGVHLQLGRVLAASSKTDDAIAELETALKLTPGDKEAQRDLAELFNSTGKYQQSEPLYRSLLAQNPKDAELHHSLGQSLMKQKKFPEAQQEFLAAIQLKPDLGSAYGDLAAVANEMQNYQLTIKALDARAKLLPEIPLSYFLRATAYDHLRDYKQAAVNYHLFLQVANGQLPDQEWQARHRLIAIEAKK